MPSFAITKIMNAYDVLLLLVPWNETNLKFFINIIYICIAKATSSIFLYRLEVSLHLLFVVIYLRASGVFDEMCRNVFMKC